MFRFRVSYIHLKGYYVTMAFDTFEKAEEYISNNALIWPLPGLVREYEVRNDTNYCRL